MYLAAGEIIKAIEIMGQNGWVERYKKLCVLCLVYTYIHVLYSNEYRILNLVHDVDKSDKEILQCSAQHLKRLAQFNSAAEVLEKLGDIKALVALHIETQQWHYVS
jgi:intraflagellar transport protein 122